MGPEDGFYDPIFQTMKRDGDEAPSALAAMDGLVQQGAQETVVFQFGHRILQSHC